MKKRVLPILVGCVLFALNSFGSALQKDTLFAKQLKPIGRTIINKAQQLELITSGAHFGFSFKGATCTIYAAAAYAGGHGYLQYKVDGVYQKRIRVEGNANEPITIKVSGSGEHHIWIYKATEATTGAIIITKIAAQNVQSQTVPNRPLIEYIGDSITCGAAADDSEVPCNTGDYEDHHNAYMAYGPRVARALNANFVMTSVSGIGIYRTWNREDLSMPMVYENTGLSVDDTQKWDFKTYSPAVVSIALGTNDLSMGDGTPRAAFDTVRFVTAYIKFVQLVKSKYPKARIALLSSPMVKGEWRQVLQHCLTRIKTKIDAQYPKDKPVATFFFEPMEPHGCAGHPSVADHGILAEELTPFFTKLLK